MGLINSIREKHAEVSAQRDNACAEAAFFVCGINEFISSKTRQFIDIEWAVAQEEESGAKLDNLAKLSHMAVTSKAKLTEARKELEDIYNNIVDRIQLHNEDVARSLIAEGRQLIGEVEGRQLDDQQMICIVKPAHNHLVIAGAGTGKTTTIVGKIKYLLNSGKYKPDDILVLSFTNASAAEMSERIRKETNCNIAASTFHKLGLDIITKAEGIVPKISKINPTEFCKKCFY